MKVITQLNISSSVCPQVIIGAKSYLMFFSFLAATADLLLDKLS